MNIESWIVGVVVGTLVGLLTGVLPGLHVNTLAAIGILATQSPAMAIGLISAGTAHTVLSVIPATFIGVPSDDAPTTALPAHRLYLQGQGFAAVQIGLQASLIAVLVGVLLVPVLWLATGVFGNAPWQILLPIILVLIIASLFWLAARDGRRPLLWAILIFLSSGALSFLAAASPMQGIIPGGSFYLPLLAGLFGLPTLLTALSGATNTIEQVGGRNPKIAVGDIARGVAASSVTAFMPGLTAATAATFARAGADREDPGPALATLCSIDTAHATLSLALLWIIGAARTGLADVTRSAINITAWAVEPPRELAWVMAAVLLAAVVAAVAGRQLAHTCSAVIGKIGQTGISVAATLFLIALIVLLTGVGGILVAAAATALGVVPLQAGVRRIYLTGALLVPIIVAA